MLISERDSNVENALIEIPGDEFTILLAHEPDIADNTGQYPIDLQLSGHSYGGQIRLPFIGPLFRPDGAKKYVKGNTK
ncbi:hypothetical protein [Peribacillus cavernae]|uniref:hypothetical protein n=1 Tax=Peribacillus cavernae TaxID=1674310 RepID=UPI00163BE0A7|nr:hypothetical protein [Peribacillus cavernae]